MKNLLLILTVCAFSFSAVGQRLTANEMIVKTQCASFECFREFVTKKGYSYHESHAKSSNKYYIFQSAESVNIDKVNIKNTVTFLRPDNGKNICVELRTAHTAYYKQLLQAFKDYGFISTNIIEREIGVQLLMEYKYENLVLVVTVEGLGEGDDVWTSYDLHLTRTR